MGLSCKPFGKVESMLRKLKNEQTKKQEEHLKKGYKNKDKK